MTCTGSAKFSELRICGYHGCSNQHTSLLGKERGRSVSINLSSCAVRQDAWSLNLLNSVHGPINPVSSRCKVFLCRSVLLPGGGNEIPVLKSAAVVVTRSYDYLCRSPLVLRLIPAVGIIAFAAWGLGPVMRFGRIVFFHRTDNSWKKSSTHYVLTSYLQPLLLWSGAILICRALDPVMLPTETSQAVKQRLLNFVRSLSSVLAFAYCLSSLIHQVQNFLVATNDASDTRNQMGFDFTGKAVYTAVWVAAVSLFMELLGFSTQKWLTAGGLGTVLLTLAGREIFTNFLSSVMIHATRPFVANEWIQTKIEGYEVSGTVEHVGWWSPTVIRGDDREAVHIPNHKFTVNVVRNISQKTHWRIKTHFAISHLDVNKINNIVADMRKVLAKNPQVEQQRLHRRVFLENINPESQALMVLVSCFVKTSHIEEYLCVKEAIILDLLRVISHHRARLATPIRTIQKVYSEADLENVPFSEDFTRSRAAAHHSFLLIEPSYKIKGDDKAKNLTRTVQTNEENIKVNATSTSESKEDAKSLPMLNPDSEDDKAVATSTSKSVADSHVSPMQASNSEAWNSVVDGSAEIQDPGENGAVCKDNVQIISEDTTIEEGKSLKTPATNQESSGPTDASSAMSNSKQIIEKSTASSMARPPLEDNIVLGVALEGSKRVLPIEEEIVSPIFAQPKELAAHKNGNGSPSAGKDTKDGQMAADQQD